MKKTLRAVNPLVYIPVLFAVAAALLLGAVPFVISQGIPKPAAAAAAPPHIFTAPTACLSPKPNYAYANNRFDKAKAGAGSSYKESENAQGPSALPENMVLLSAAERLQVVRSEFINRHCGGKKLGGDKKLFQVGFVGSDNKNLTASPSHRHMNPNATISRPEWVQGLEGYLATIRWDMSRLVYEKLGKDTWTLAMEPRPGKEPWVKLVKHEQPKSWYLMLAVTQPDGTIAYERRRLECGFQQTYIAYRDVPTAFKLMQVG